jgi:hypothetical protein
MESMRLDVGETCWISKQSLRKVSLNRMVNQKKKNATSKGDVMIVAGPERVELSVSESESDALTTWQWPNLHSKL